MSDCYCHSSSAYEACCQPFIEGQNKPETPEQLMRSRFTAFVLHRWRYILDTWHPDFRPDCTEAELEQDAKQSNWIKLVVLSSQQDADGQHGKVSFCAWFKDKNGLHLHHEASSFSRDNGNWVYTSGQFLPAPAQFKLKPNEPCPCGSGKKYKKCCANRE